MYETISHISDWIILLPLLTGAVVFKKSGFDSRLILLVVAAGTIPQMFHFFLQDTKIQWIAYNLYSPIEFVIFFLLFYSKVFIKKIKSFFYFTCVLSAIASIWFIAKYDFSNRFINQWTLFNNITYLLWIVLYINQAFDYDRGDLTPRNSFFWYTTGILIYATCTTIVYLLWQKIFNSPLNSVLKILRSVQNIFNIILYIFFTVGILIEYNSSKKKKQLQLNICQT